MLPVRRIIWVALASFLPAAALGDLLADKVWGRLPVRYQGFAVGRWLLAAGFAASSYTFGLWLVALLCRWVTSVRASVASGDSSNSTLLIHESVLVYDDDGMIRLVALTVQTWWLCIRLHALVAVTMLKAAVGSPLTMAATMIGMLSLGLSLSSWLRLFIGRHQIA